MITHLLHDGFYGIVVGDGLLADRCYLIGYATGIGEGFASFLDSLYAAREFVDEGEV